MIYSCSTQSSKDFSVLPSWSPGPENPNPHADWTHLPGAIVLEFDKDGRANSTGLTHRGEILLEIPKGQRAKCSQASGWTYLPRDDCSI